MKMLLQSVLPAHAAFAPPTDPTQYQISSSCLKGIPLQAMMQGIHPLMVSFLDIRVRREAVLTDAINQLMVRQNDLKKPLRVTFISAGIDEEAQVSICYVP